MHSRLLIPALLFFTFSAKAQSDLSDSRQTSVYTYVYRLSGREALFLYQHDMKGWELNCLHTLVDSFPTGSPEITRLLPGNYLFVHAEGSRLSAALQTVGPLRYQLLNTGGKVALTLHTPAGEMITDASVSIRHRRPHYDPATNSYLLGSWSARKLVKIAYGDGLYMFEVGRYLPGDRHHSWGWFLVHTSFRKRYRYKQPVRYESRFRTFLVFSKPKYKPADTVEGKAFIMDSKGRPLDRPLVLRLADHANVDTALRIIRPYRPGGYVFSFVLSDSLKLRLDERCTVSLEEPDRRPAKQKDDDDDKRKTVSRADFDYEEYNLSSIRLEGRVNRQEHVPGEPVSVFLKALDENDLPVADGRVTLSVTSRGDASQFQGSSVYIKDTLWTWTQPLDPVGETRIDLPDSIFPPASLSYTIGCVFLNSDNERYSTYFQQSWHYDTARLTFSPHTDSIDIDYKIRGRSTPSAAMAYGLFGKDTVERRLLTLPATLRVSPYADKYEVRIPTQGDSLVQRYVTEDIAPWLYNENRRTKDSVYLHIDNPYRLNFWYTLTTGGRILQRGYGNSLDYAQKSVTDAPYILSLSYLWTGILNKREFTIPFREQQLHLEIRQPDYVYPGQSAMVEVGVRDASGVPVANADLTAWSYTSKFGADLPAHIPYLGKRYPVQKQVSYSLPAKENSLVSATPLNWPRWHKAFGLDTIEFYKFLNPEKLYINREPARDGQTQVAPFVSRMGQPEPVALLYIDEQLVYFSQAEQLRRYSFPTDSGWHSLRIRTAWNEYRLDSIHLARGTKTFIGINDDSTNKTVRISKRPDTLLYEEKELLRHSLLIVQNVFGNQFALVTEGQFRHYLLNTSGSNSHGNSWLTGPFTGQGAVLQVKDRYTQAFGPEGGYAFDIYPGLVRERQWPGPYPFNRYLLQQEDPGVLLRDRALRPGETDSLWQDYLDQRSANDDLFHNHYTDAWGNGVLKIGGLPDTGKAKLFVRKIFLFRYDEPTYMRIYKGIDRSLGYIQPGVYRLLLLLKGDHYLLRDSIRIQPNGLNYYGLDRWSVQAPDSFSRRISALLHHLEGGGNDTDGEGLDSMRVSFSDRYLDMASLHREVWGRVTDEKGRPLAGASIMIKGTRLGTSTDAYGLFRLKVPEKAMLSYSYVGYTTVAQPVERSECYEVTLLPIRNSLDEVVVMGYGISRKREITGAVSYLEGRVAGLDIEVSADRSLPAEAQKAIAEAITRAQRPDPGDTIIRRFFRDNAWWQPQLRTDVNGLARFEVHYPDDITSWKTFAIAVTDHRQTGMTSSGARAFKPLSAGLSLPAFLVAGDKANGIGKLLSYLPDSVTVERTISVNGRQMVGGRVSLLNARIDTFLLQPETRDSLRLTYTMRRADGYFDGEERNIPVFPAGTKETKGNFAALEGDTTMRLSFDSALGPVHVHAEASLLPVLLDEIEHVSSYEYFCNEQLGSKLKVLLAKKKVYLLLHKEFKEEKNITQLIDKLVKARGRSPLWGWWPDAPALPWVSLHVAEALLAAEAAGYMTGLDKQPLIDYLVFSLGSGRPATSPLEIRLLQQLQAKVNYKSYIDTLAKYYPRQDLYQTLRLVQLQQEAGLPYRLDTLLVKRQYTAMGNCYWGNDGYLFFDNAIQNTLLMYCILRKAGGYEQLLRKMRNFLLEQRGHGYWRNTYESCLVLETILPDVAPAGASLQPPVLGLEAAGSAAGPAKGIAIRSFPYEQDWPAGIPLNITKTGQLPVYFTAYQQFFNPAPQKETGVFAVRTFFQGQGFPVTKLKAGEPVSLEVEVDVKGEADYVMIEVPIPAGCSYAGKSQSYDYQEIHREYFKNKLSIFSQFLSKGKHLFIVRLMPRYTGVYQLNPARAELMYFPVLYGREGMKTVEIE